MGARAVALCFPESKSDGQGAISKKRNATEFPALGLEGSFFIREGHLRTVIHSIQKEFIQCIAKSAGLGESNVFLQAPEVQKGPRVYKDHDEVILKVVVMAPVRYKRTMLRSSLLQNVATKLDDMLRDNELLYTFKPAYRNLHLGPDESESLQRLQFTGKTRKYTKTEKMEEKHSAEEKAKQKQDIPPKKVDLNTVSGTKTSHPSGSQATLPTQSTTPTVTRSKAVTNLQNVTVDHLRGNPSWLYSAKWSSELSGQGLRIDASQTTASLEISHYQNAYTLRYAQGPIWLWEINVEDIIHEEKGLRLRSRQKRSEENEILIGVTDTPSELHSFPFARGSFGGTAIAYRSDGKLERSDLRTPIHFGEQYASGDRITIRISQSPSGTTVEFFKNQKKQGKSLGNECKHLELKPGHNPLRCAVALPRKGHSVRLGEAINIQEMNEVFRTGVQTSFYGMVITKTLTQKLMHISLYKRVQILSKEWLVETLLTLAQKNHTLYMDMSDMELVLLSTLLNQDFPEPDYEDAINGLQAEDDDDLDVGEVTLETLEETKEFRELPTKIQEDINALVIHFRGYLPSVNVLKTYDWDEELPKIEHFRDKSESEMEEFKSQMKALLAKYQRPLLDIKEKENKKRKKKRTKGEVAMDMVNEAKAESEFKHQIERLRRVAIHATEATNFMLEILEERGDIKSLEPPRIKSDGTGRHFDFDLWIENLEEVDDFYLNEAFRRLRDGIDINSEDVTLGYLLTVLAKNYPKLRKHMSTDTRDFKYRDRTVSKQIRACMRKAGETVAMCKLLQDLDRQQAKRERASERWYSKAVRKRLEEEQKLFWIDPTAEPIQKPFLILPQDMLENIKNENKEAEKKEKQEGMTEEERQRERLRKLILVERPNHAGNYIVSIAYRLRNNGKIKICRLELNGKTVICTDVSKIEKALANKTTPKPLVELDLNYTKINFQDKKQKWKKYPEYDGLSLEFQIYGSTLNVAFETEVCVSQLRCIVAV
ncbi:hypothetical protein AAMO2058_000757300 [Amorphochlora amoebiformis]